MSLRQIAKQLGITPAYLSYMVNGKRPWRPSLYDRYRELVNTFVNSSKGLGDKVTPPQAARHIQNVSMVGRTGRNQEPRPPHWSHHPLAWVSCR